MLSLFPSLLSWNQISPFLIRLVLGIIFVLWAQKELRNPLSSAQIKLAGLLEFASGLLLIIGLYTQLAAAVLALDLLIRLIGKAKAKLLLSDGINYYVVLLVLALSLLVTGAGMFSFDLPL